MSKRSKIIIDLLTTTFAQTLFLVFSVILIRIMSTALIKEYFGIFMLIRRILGIAVPLVTINLGVGLARYISYEKENEKEFLNVSLWVVITISLITIIFFGLLGRPLSKLFFNMPNYTLFLVLTGGYILGYSIFQVAYAFFRGRQDMITANKLQIFYSLGPVVFVAILWFGFSPSCSKLLYLYLLFTFLWGVFLGIGYLYSYIKFLSPLTLIKKIVLYKKLFLYSFSRIPSGFLLALTIGIPVFVASHKLSLADAAYVGIAVAILKLLGAFTLPVNLIFLPKFAEIKKRDTSQEIKSKISIIIEFILTFLPLLSVLTYGLSKYIVLLFFGTKYTLTIPMISVVILFSPFYLSYVIIRGILDGLFYFPYVNMICFTSFLTTVLLTFIFHENFIWLTIDLCIGVSVLGIIALVILIKKSKIVIKLKYFMSFILAVIVFFILFWMDKYINSLHLGILIKFFLTINLRIFILIILFLYYWKPKTKWSLELINRLKTK